ncbi:hypothetical protein Tco_1447188 [Tanacetum coccineum]
MRTRRSNYPNNSNVTISRRRRRQVSNIVELEIQTIVAPIAERTMKELLRTPTEGYEEAIVLQEINADHFEIKTNLLQLVQANPFYGRESENSHAHINSFKRITSTLRFRNVPNDVIKLMMFPYSLEINATSSKTDERIDKLADQLSTLVEIVSKKSQTNFQGSTTQIPPSVIPISILEPDVPKTLPKTTPIPESDIPKSLPKPNIPYPSRRDDQKSRDKASNQMEKIFQIFQDLRFDISFADALLLMPRFAPTIKSLLMNKECCLQDFLILDGKSTLTLEPVYFRIHFWEDIEAYLKEDSYSPELIMPIFNPEDDICLIEKLLNNDPFQLPPMDLKQKNDTLPVIIAKGLNMMKDALFTGCESHKGAMLGKSPTIRTMEVFMDDFSVFGDSFDSCLSNLEKMLKRCEDTNLVLNWEKCHCFYRPILSQDFSKIARPLLTLLEKETTFVFSRIVFDGFSRLLKMLTEATILVVPDWNLTI